MALGQRVLRSNGLRVTALVTLVTFASACRTWSVVPLKEIETGQPVELTDRIRVTLRDGGEPTVLNLQRIEYPNVTGVVEDEGAKANPKVVTLDLRQATQVEIWSVSGWRTALLVTGIVLGALAVIAVIIVATKTSCPFVYVDDGSGLRFVGEAYSGATSRATQRKDLMPLPSLGLRPSMVLSNEARETQFTDLLEVVVVDRAPGTRALATHDAGLVLVREAWAPRSATDLDGRDVLGVIRDSDGQVWQTDLDSMARRPDSPLREGLVVTFPAPAAGGPLALELDAGNTLWLDVVFGRFFALLGDRLDTYLDDTDKPESRGPTLAWREREGVDLRVEVERGGRWERVAVVPTVGPASLRRFAVPIGPANGNEVRVRLSGGVGFWQADLVALASIEPTLPVERRFAPVRAVERGVIDVRALLASPDGNFQVLPVRGGRVDLSFELPPPAAGLERDAFLRTSGYYRVHTPPQSELSAGTLYRLRDEPGSLSRFSLDLFRGYLGITSGPVASAP